jgi:hypothetical protein
LVELVPFSFVQQRQAAGPEFPPPLLFCGKEIGFGKLLEEVYPKGDMRNFQFPEIFYQSFAGRRTGKKKEKGVPEARGTLILAPISFPAPKAAKFKKAHIPERSQGILPIDSDQTSKANRFKEAAARSTAHKAFPIQASRSSSSPVYPFRFLSSVL